MYRGTTENDELPAPVIEIDKMVADEGGKLCTKLSHKVTNEYSAQNDKETTEAKVSQLWQS